MIEFLGKLSKKLDYQGHGIRYWLADLTGDGRSEVIVQEAVWSASGYALAIFSYHGGFWKKIAQHRGGFILNRNEINGSYKLTLIEKSGADYGLFWCQYRDGSYNLMKRISPFRDISFEQFWFYNMTRVEYCQSPIRNPLGRSTFCR